MASDAIISAPPSLDERPAEQRTQSDAAIAVAGVGRRFGKRFAIHDLSFNVPQGCICAFLGPNGAGKTTTIRMLLGLIPPQEGTISVLGMQPPRHYIELRQQVGYVPDQQCIYRWMTVPQVFSFASRLYRNWDRPCQEEMATLLKLPENRRVGELSRGELAKLALVIALAHRPRLLILDEPTTGLDPLVRDEFLTVILQLYKERGGTVFFSTHILSDVERIATQVVVLHQGHVLQQGSLDDLRAHYTKLSFFFRNPPPGQLQIPGALRIQRGVREWVAIFPAMPAEGIRQVAQQIGADDCLSHSVTVDDLFLELFGRLGGN
jgi:ABC-2 type transport system ATP-binding protein